MEAVGVYVRTLRDLRGMNQEALARAIGVHVRTIRNMESAKHASKPADLDAALKHLKGSWAHIARLMPPDAKLDLARELAQEAFSETGFTEEERSYLEGLTPEQKDALITVARQMQR